MRTLFLVLLVALGGVLSGCVATTDDGGLDRMRRNQDAARATAA